jgi:4-hydroxy-3-methylbut-2-en-1-yl diphosphate reductase
VLPPHERLAVLTQTTLSVDEVTATLDVLKWRFPHLETPKKGDICYATTNRQMAVRELATQCDLVVVVGSQTSSNSKRLREVAAGLGTDSFLINSADEVLPEWSEQYRSIGITSGASTPETVVEDVIGALMKGRTDVPVQILETIKEDITFQPSRNLIQLAMSR